MLAKTGDVAAGYDSFSEMMLLASIMKMADRGLGRLEPELARICDAAAG